MAVARKSDVSATGSWFRTAIQNLGNRRSTSLRKPSSLRTTLARSVPDQSKVSVMSAPLSPIDTFQRRSVVTRHTRASLPLEKPHLERVRASFVSSKDLLTPHKTQFPQVGEPFRQSLMGVTNMTALPHQATGDSTLVPTRGPLLNSLDQNTQVSSRRRRRSSKNLSVSTQQFPRAATTAQSATTNNASTPTPVQELDAPKVPSIPVMPNSESIPLWLLRLYTIHRHSSVVAFLLVIVTLVIYGWTVYSQQLWTQAYHKLQDLQHHERQLTTTNEVLKEKMAQEAQRPAAGLVSPTPKGTIFLPTAPLGPNPVSLNTTPDSEAQQQTANPVGY